MLGIAYVLSSMNTLEYLDEAEQKPTAEQPKSGAPPPDSKTLGKLGSILSGLKKDSVLAGPGGKLPTEKGKSVTEPPPSKTTVKPHTDAVEKFSMF
jgi:hypothetical protein